MLLIIPPNSQAADDNIVRLQRDVALLNDNVRRLKSAIDGRMDNLVAMVKQALDRVGQTHEASSRAQRTLLADRRQRQEKIDRLLATLEQVRVECAAMKERAYAA